MPKFHEVRDIIYRAGLEQGIPKVKAMNIAIKYAKKLTRNNYGK